MSLSLRFRVRVSSSASRATPILVVAPAQAVNRSCGQISIRIHSQACLYRCVMLVGNDTGRHGTAVSSEYYARGSARVLLRVHTQGLQQCAGRQLDGLVVGRALIAHTREPAMQPPATSIVLSMAKWLLQTTVPATHSTDTWSRGRAIRRSRSGR
jgi:hypothetical protein